MRGGFGDQDVRALGDELRGEFHRKLARQGELVEVHLRRSPLGGRAADQRCQQVIALRELLLQLGNRGLVGRQLALQAQDVGISHGAGLRLDLGELHLLASKVNQPLRGVDLGLVSRLGHDGVHDVRYQCEIGGLLIGALQIHLGVQLLDHPALSSEDVEGVAHRGGERKEIEYTRGHPVTQLQGRDALARSGLETRIVAQRLGDDGIDLGVVEEVPPIRAQPGARGEMLGGALRIVRRNRVASESVVFDRRRFWPDEIRTHRAAAQERGDEGRRVEPQSPGHARFTHRHTRPPVARDKDASPWDSRTGR